jgi:hypothetical protein
MDLICRSVTTDIKVHFDPQAVFLPKCNVKPAVTVGLDGMAGFSIQGNLSVGGWVWEWRTPPAFLVAGRV